MKKLFIALLLFSGCTSANPASYTVMVTNLEENSGGSGSIVSATETQSQILTNAHVCRVVQFGGIVRGLAGQAFVVSYKVSERHDLCLITVAADLGASTRLSNLMPEPYQEIQVSGHPHLMPTIISKGHIADKRIIPVMQGTRPCTDAELNDSTLDFMCHILGKLPMVKFYETNAISATIQPGSSGSGVYNTRGEILAVVFAGDSDFGYGYAVPYESVYAFLNTELKTLSEQYPDASMRFSKGSENDRGLLQAIKEACLKNPIKSEICKGVLSILTNDSIFGVK